MTQTITLIEGDGIGPEVTAATRRVLDAAGADVDWDVQVAGSEAIARHGEPLPTALLDSIKRHKVALKGPVTTPVGKGFRSINVQLRRALELYANLRPVRSLPNVPSRYSDIDLVIVRENTEGLYSGLEHEVTDGVVESLKIITRSASTRIARYAFEYASEHGRKRITAVHKANIMKLSDGLFLDCFHQVASGYAEITADDRIIDNMCMQLVMRPETFDMLLLENLYGDIVSDLAAGLVGGLGVCPGVNVGTEVSIFEAVHGSAPDIAGQDLANPLALIRSAELMLRHIGQDPIADRVEAAILATLERGVRTRDIGGTASTHEFTEALVEALEGLAA
jgi:isocitrate dehydrogenase (NAD+)